MQGFASYANTYANGIVPTNNFQRHNMTLKETIKLFNNKVTVDGSLNYIIQKGTNRPEGGQYFSPLTGLYTFLPTATLLIIRITTRHSML